MYKSHTMDRNTLVLYSDGLYKTTLGDVLDSYGIDTACKLFGKVLKFEYTFPNHATKGGVSAWQRGRPSHHLTKAGKIKKMYKGKKIHKVLFDEFQHIASDSPPLLHNVCIVIQRAFRTWASRRIRAAMIIKSAVRRWFSKRAWQLARMVLSNNVDCTTDIISCEELDQPCIIRSDWKIGSMVIYNLKTIRQLLCTTPVPLYSIVDVDGSEHIEYGEYIHTTHEGFVLYKSPTTRNKFTYVDVMCLHDKLWFELAKRLQMSK